MSKFTEGDEVTSAIGAFDGTGEVTEVTSEQGVTTVRVQVPQDSGLTTLAGIAGFAPEDLRQAG